MLAACNGGCWVDQLGDVLAGMRLLPTRSGWAPYLLVFKQEPRWLSESTGTPPPDEGDLPTTDDGSAYVAAVA